MVGNGFIINTQEVLGEVDDGWGKGCMSMAFFYVVFLLREALSCAMGNEWNYMFDPAVTQRLCT